MGAGSNPVALGLYLNSRDSLSPQFQLSLSSAALDMYLYGLSPQFQVSLSSAALDMSLYGLSPQFPVSLLLL